MNDIDSAVLVFSKAPVHGTVKTRLSPGLDHAEAVTLYMGLIQRTLGTATAVAADVRLYCSPGVDHPFFQACRDRYEISLFSQQGEDLGDRMATAVDETHRECSTVILVGCDCPELSQDDLRTACERLQSGDDVVLGPCEDGGYYLVGTSRPVPEMFTGIEWGTGNVLAQTRDRLKELGLRWYELPTRWDLDDVADLQRYQSM